MASKFEIILLPRVAAVLGAGAVLFTAAVFVTSRFVPGDGPPYKDFVSPDGEYAASIEQGSVVNVTAKRLHGKWWTLAKGDHRITGVKWVGSKNLEVLFKPGDPNGADDPKDLPRERSRFFDVAVTYKMSNSSTK